MTTTLVENFGTVRDAAIFSDDLTVAIGSPLPVSRSPEFFIFSRASGHKKSGLEAEIGVCIV